MISIVTATYNSADRLPDLIASLRAQTDRRFEWIVADGASKDGTVGLVNEAFDLGPVITSQPDFGIYDALNRAIAAANGSHYLVVGSDDRLHPEAVAKFNEAIALTGADIIVADVLFGARRVRARGGPPWLHGAQSYISNHSLGTAFRKELHARFGWYSKKYPLAADALFVVKACNGGARRHQADFVAGEMGQSGVSATDWAGSATEFFRVQLDTGCAFPMQAGLLFLRLIKGRFAILRLALDRLRKVNAR